MKIFLVLFFMISCLFPQELCEGTCLSEEQTIEIFNSIKDLFLDNELQDKTSLTAINSINWARIMLQTVYYFWAFLQLDEDKVSFIVH